MDSFVSKLGERLLKPVDLVVRGADVRVDARRVRPIFQNFAHLVRNAIDHGIEPSELRGAKPARARLELIIAETAHSWTFCLNDDGAGIDRQALCEKAVRSGARSQAQVDAMSESEQLELVFLDGLSTKELATEISGRGVGLAAVRAAVLDLGGRVEVRSEPGRGAGFLLVVPKPPSGEEPAGSTSAQFAA